MPKLNIEFYVDKNKGPAPLSVVFTATQESNEKSWQDDTSGNLYQDNTIQNNYQVD